MSFICPWKCLSVGVTAGSAFFPMYLSEETKHGIARRCTSSPRYTNARFLGSLAAVALPCIAWKAQLLAIFGYSERPNLSSRVFPCLRFSRCLPSDSLSAFGPIYYCLLRQRGTVSSRHQQVLVAAALPASTFHSHTEVKSPVLQRLSTVRNRKKLPQNPSAMSIK